MLIESVVHRFVVLHLVPFARICNDRIVPDDHLNTIIIQQVFSHSHHWYPKLFRRTTVYRQKRIESRTPMILRLWTVVFVGSDSVEWVWHRWNCHLDGWIPIQKWHRPDRCVWLNFVLYVVLVDTSFEKFSFDITISSQRQSPAVQRVAIFSRPLLLSLAYVSVFTS